MRALTDFGRAYGQGKAHIPLACHNYFHSNVPPLSPRDGNAGLSRF